MEKRLPLALFLSFLVLFGWQILFPPPPPENSPEEGNTSIETTLDTNDVAAASAVVPDQLAPLLAATQAVESEPVIFGEDDQPGHLRATFSNRGARLLDLEFEDYFRYFRRKGLTDEQIAATEETHRMPLVVRSRNAGHPSGALVLETSKSSEAYAPGGLANALWTMEVTEGDEPTVRFEYGASTGFIFRKTIRSVPGTWLLEMELEFENGSELPGGSRQFMLRPADFVPPELGDRFYPEPRAVAVGPVGTNSDLDVEWEQVSSNVDETGTLDASLPLAEVGIHSKYFALLVRDHPDNPAPTLMGALWSAFKEEPMLGELADDNGELGAIDLVGGDTTRVTPELGPLAPERMSVLVPLKLTMPEPGGKATYRYLIYAGPKDRATMTADSPASEALMNEDLSSFDSLAAIGRGLLWVLSKFHSLVGNWGTAIILLTLSLRIILFPLQRRSQTAMARYSKVMKKVQPRLEELKTKYADDAQRQRQEQAKIMQEEGAFPPIGGCMPMFLQIPVFIGLFSALRTSFDLRQAPFMGWIDDLSQPDRLFELGLEVPLLVTTLDLSYFNLLPILMVVLWILQQKGMPTPNDPQQAKMQRMMTFMPILFGFMLYNYAAGLSLYMITQSSLGIVEQRVIKKIWPIDDTTPEKVKKEPKGCGPLSGAMQNMAEKQKAEMERRQAQSRKQQGGGSKPRKKKR